MPAFDAIVTIAHPELLLIDPDTTGDWLRVGSGPWHRIRILVEETLTVYLLELRLDDGQIVEFHRSEVSQT